MRCTKCNSKKARVLDTRLSISGLVRKRHRQCLECGHKYHTLEYEYPSDERLAQARGAMQNMKKELFKLTGVAL